MVLKTVIGLIKELDRKYYTLMVISLVLALSLALTEGVGLLLLIPLMHIAGVSPEGGGQLPGFLNLFLEKTGIELTISSALLLYCGVISLFTILRFLQSLFSVYISERVTKEKKDLLYKKVLHSKWQFISQRKSSDLIHIFGGRISVYGAMVQNLVSVVLALVLLLLYAVVASYISLPMTLLSIVSALVMAAFLIPINRKIHQVGKDSFEANRELHSIIKESVEGIKSTKSYGIEEGSEKAFSMATGSLKHSMLRFVKLTQSTQALYKIGSVFTIALIFYIAITWFHFDAVRLFLFLMIFSRVIPQVSSIHNLYQSFINTIPTYKEVSTLFSESGLNQEHETSDELPISFNNSLKLQNIRFSYSSESSFALSFKELSINRGSNLLIIGQTGSGKSTLLDILMGLLEPTDGTLSVDGTPLVHSEWKKFRQLTAYVPQVPFLFHDSIRENLRIVSPDASDEELWSVLEMVEAKVMVQKMPQGLDTIIGDRGVSLSGGERQRIALARVLLIKPEILILDEATNALDNRVEAKVLKALREESGIETFITVTHRIEQLDQADEVIVIHDGTIVQKGSPEQIRNSKVQQVQELLRS